MSDAREERLRRRARSLGLVLHKRERSWMIVDPTTTLMVAGDHFRGYGLTLDQVEQALDE